MFPPQTPNNLDSSAFPAPLLEVKHGEKSRQKLWETRGRRTTAPATCPTPLSAGPWHCPPPVRKKPTQPNQCWRAFLLRAAERDRSILERKPILCHGGKGQGGGGEPGPLCFGSGGCEFLTGLRSVVTNYPLPQRTQLVGSGAARAPPCSKPALRAQLTPRTASGWMEQATQVLREGPPMASLSQGQASLDLDKPWGAMPGLRVP